jgi:hypothetical protein
LFPAIPPNWENLAGFGYLTAGGGWPATPSGPSRAGLSSPAVSRVNVASSEARARCRDPGRGGAIGRQPSRTGTILSWNDTM